MNYFKIAKDFARAYNFQTGNIYVVKKGKDYKHLQAVSVVVKDNDWNSLFNLFFEWHKDSVWCKDNKVLPTLGLLEASINSVVSFKKPDTFKYKEL